jgi:hypothetical protein
MARHVRDWIELNLTEREAKTALKAIDKMLDEAEDVTVFRRGDFSNILIGALDLDGSTE